MLPLFALFHLAISANLFDVGSTFPHLAHGQSSSHFNDKQLLKSLAEYAHRAHMVVTKRCANLFDESCVNGGLPGANTDEEWLNNLGKRSSAKRCANLFDEGCVNGGLPGSNTDEEWLNGLGKRSPTRKTATDCENLFDEACENGGLPGGSTEDEWLTGITKTGNKVENDQGFFKSLSDFFNRVHLVTVKRCANLFDETCANGGIPEAGKDESWLEGIGKRNADSEKTIYKSLAHLFNRLDAARERRCANLFDESCVNGGLPGANNDEEWLNNLGKRDLKGLLKSIHLG